MDADVAYCFLWLLFCIPPCNCPSYSDKDKEEEENIENKKTAKRQKREEEKKIKEEKKRVKKELEFKKRHSTESLEIIGGKFTVRRLEEFLNANGQ